MFYDGTKLLSLKDINGKLPEIYISTDLRSSGKTTYFNRLCVNKFKKNGSKFGLLYRFNYEMDGVADKFFKDIRELFFPNDTMTSKTREHGKFVELFLNNVSCGYAIPINAADTLKKCSHYFSDIDRLLFDEFQSETNHYCPDEVRRFQSIHVSIARGQGSHTRYVPVYMISNTVSLLNPYFTALGISHKIQKTTKILRGNGYVLQQGFNESASVAQLESGFNRAFVSSNYNSYSAQGVYLNDNMSFIERPVGKNRYLLTLRYKGCDYGVREYGDIGVLYVSRNADCTFPVKISVTTDDMNINYVMLRNNAMIISNLRYFFDNGCFRFENLECKECLMKCLSY